jgi:hypothetical protein
MNLTYIRAEVDRRVAEQMPVVLFERSILLHKKVGSTNGCKCSYCCLKRASTSAIANAGYHRRDSVKRTYMFLLSQEMKKYQGE